MHSQLVCRSLPRLAALDVAASALGALIALSPLFVQGLRKPGPKDHLLGRPVERVIREGTPPITEVRRGHRGPLPLLSQSTLRPQPGLGSNGVWGSKWQLTGHQRASACGWVTSSAAPTQVWLYHQTLHLGETSAKPDPKSVEDQGCAGL